MKKSMIVAVCAGLALAACNSAEEAAPEAPAETEAPAVEAPLAADGQPAVGTYEVTQADGSKGTEVVNEDGTYTWTAEDGTTSAGTWRTEGPNVYCTTEEGGEESCYDETVGEDGVWTSTDRSDPAKVSTIVRVTG